MELIILLARVQKWGNSQGIRIPKNILRLASMKEGDEVEIIAEYNQIIIRRTPPIIKPYSLQELFSQYEVEEQPKEVDWGSPSGKEEW